MECRLGWGRRLEWRRGRFFLKLPASRTLRGSNTSRGAASHTSTGVIGEMMVRSVLCVVEAGCALQSTCNLNEATHESDMVLSVARGYNNRCATRDTDSRHTRRSLALAGLSPSPGRPVIRSRTCGVWSERGAATRPGPAPPGVFYMFNEDFIVILLW